jgi:hypothetical protein
VDTATVEIYWPGLLHNDFWRNFYSDLNQRRAKSFAVKIMKHAYQAQISRSLGVKGSKSKIVSTRVAYPLCT